MKRQEKWKSGNKQNPIKMIIVFIALEAQSDGVPLTSDSH